MITTDCNVNELIYADEVHFIGVIENLIDNSIKYSGNSVSIHISFNIQNDSLYIKVKDNGYGISKKNIHKIFGKYERCDAIKRNEAKGYGLGLNYVKRIVKAHRGNISVTSTEGIGTEFTIEIPVNKRS